MKSTMMGTGDALPNTITATCINTFLKSLYLSRSTGNCPLTYSSDVGSALAWGDKSVTIRRQLATSRWARCENRAPFHSNPNFLTWELIGLTAHNDPVFLQSMYSSNINEYYYDIACVLIYFYVFSLFFSEI